MLPPSTLFEYICLECLEKRVASTRQKETFRLRWRHHENKINLMQPEENKQKNLHSGVIRFSVSS